jgi:GT2 family glycosyltransferase
MTIRDASSAENGAPACLADNWDELIIIDDNEVDGTDEAAPKESTFPRYQEWLKHRGLRLVDSEVHAERLARWQIRPRFLMISVVQSSTLALASRTIDNLQKQLYCDWCLVLVSDQPAPSAIFNQSETLGWFQVDSIDDAEQVTKVCNALPAALERDWVTLLPPGFELDEHALLVLGDRINLNRQCAAFYTDDDCISSDGRRSQPRFKPDFDIDFLRAYDYLTPGVWVNADALSAIGGYVPLGDASQYEFLLRLWETLGDAGIGHIANPVLHLPAEWKSSDADCPYRDAAVLAHIERCALPARLERGAMPGIRRLVWEWPRWPSVAIVIPTRDKLEYLAPCVESVLETTEYPDFEIVIIDNQSEDPDTLEWFAQITTRYPNRVRVLQWRSPFNFSAINNFAAESTGAEFLCLLNNDTEVLHGPWLSRLVELGQRPDVGAVGSRLVFPETGKIQHAGVALGLMESADHPFFDACDINQAGPLNRLQVVLNQSAVTAACMLVRREDYLAVGGMDTVDLKVLFNDVDLCLKLRALGRRVLWTPYVTLIHHGSTSLKTGPRELRRMVESIERAEAERSTLHRRWMPLLTRDPFYNINLSLRRRDFSLDTELPFAADPDFYDRPRILAFPLSGGSGVYRLREPLEALSDEGRLYGDYVVFPDCLASYPNSTEIARKRLDTVVVHAGIGDQVLEFLEKTGRTLPDILRIFALDDLVTQIPQKSSVYRAFKGLYRDARPRLRAAMKLCDRVIVSTDPLADLCRDMIDDIVVIPNRLSKMWQGHTSRRNRGDKPRVGWVGASQHQGDLELIETVIEALANEVDFVFMGMATDRIRPHLAEFHQPVPWEEYPAKVASLDLDIALAPLELLPFNEAKSNLRLLEYGILGWPVVCTDIYPYRHDNAPVTRVPNAPDAWIEAIRALARDRDRRTREGDALQAWVQRGYLLEEHLEEWQQALLR